jgi:hypothetical protein
MDRGFGKSTQFIASDDATGGLTVKVSGSRPSSPRQTPCRCCWLRASAKDDFDESPWAIPQPAMLRYPRSNHMSIVPPNAGLMPTEAVLPVE